MSVLKDGELYLYGFVGDNYWDEGFTASDVIDALVEVGRDNDVVVHINSGGGYTDDGIAIFNSLKAHKGKVTVVVDAMAASSASLIVMAGDERIMLSGSLMMIHDPSGITWGTADDHAKRLDHLDKLGNLLAEIYAEAADEPSANLREDMKNTLWLSPEEAVERGFATATANENSDAIAAFDYRVYAQAPDRLVALSKKNSWSLKAAMAKKTGAPAAVKTGHKGEMTLSKTQQPGADPAPTQGQGETTVSQTNLADAATQAVAADRQRRKDVLALDEAKGREELAESLYATDLTLEQIQSSLAAAPSGQNPTVDDASTYEANRAEGSALAAPTGASTPTKAKIDRSAIFALRAKQVSGA